MAAETPAEVYPDRQPATATIVVPRPTHARLGRIQARLRRERGEYAFWQIISEALDKGGYEQ